MFGLRTGSRRPRNGGTFGSTNLRRAAVAGLGMLALSWWRNRQASSRPGSRTDSRLPEDVLPE